jgi:ferredoxin
VKLQEKKQVEMRKYPSIDLGRCSECLGCIEVAPQVFRYNTSTGMMEVIDLQQYPEDLVDEAIKNCPEDCIAWEWSD